jgi:TetR/AcrR family transcriptional regulator, mexJK operon transcriptional repressor
LSSFGPAWETCDLTDTLEHDHRRIGPAGGKAETILAAAKRAFLANGYGAVSMDAIAREAGVSKATVYAHFAGKEELFGAVIERQCAAYFGSFSADDLDPRDVRASLAAWGRRFLDLILSPDGLALHRIIVAEVTRFPALGEVFWRAGPERERGQIESFLRSAVAAGLLKVGDPRLAAEQFLSLLRGDTQLHRLLRLEDATGDKAIGDAVAGAVETMMRAFALREAESATAAGD